MMTRSKKSEIEFRCFRPGEKSVHPVTGFSASAPQSLPMSRTETGCWACRLRLPDGVYHLSHLVGLPTDEWRVCHSTFGIHWSRLGRNLSVQANQSSSEANAISAAAGQSEEHLLNCQTAHDSEKPVGSSLTLTRQEASLVHHFRTLPDAETRASFLDALQDSVSL